MSTDFRKAMAPRDVATRISEYLKEGNVDAIVSFFHPDCIVAFPPGAPPQQGLDKVRELFIPFVEAGAALISEVTGELINGDTAIVQARWRAEAADGSLMSEGNSTEVIKQNADGSWVYFIDCPTGPPAI